MRIFFVTNNYTPYSGGVVQSITVMTDELRKQGHDVFIITLNFLGNQHDDPEYVIRIACPLRFRYKKNYMAIPWRPQHAIEQLIKQHNPDIIHVHHPFLLGASAVRAAHKYHIKCVFTYHTLYEKYAHYVPLPRIVVQPLIRKIVLNFCNNVDAIIAPSSYVKNYLLSHNVKTSITIIPSPLRNIFSSHAPLHNNSKKSAFFELLLVTRFVPEKNVPFVFEVMNLLSDKFRLTLVGYGTDYEKMQKLAYDTFHFSPERIRFIHKPSQEELLATYQNADLFIFPSITDTQGIVLAESMSQGVPVIALDGPGQRDIIIDGVNGFIVAGAQHCADNINSLADDNALLQRLSLGAYETAQRYQPHTLVNQLLNVYRSI